MAEQIDHNKDNNRRKFIKRLGLLISALATGSAGFYLWEKNQSKKRGKNAFMLNTGNNMVDFKRAELKNLKLNTKFLKQQAREGLPGRSWAMVIDLSKCNNTRKCITACQEAHQLRPDQFHLNVLQMQDSPQTAAYFMPKQCQQCDSPACVSVCPVDATFKRRDGIVLIDNERCIGCRFCIAACPYSARIFNWFDPIDAEKYSKKPYNVELNVPQKKGTVSKCVFAADKLRKDELPYCVTACPNGVYWFGDEIEDAVTNGTTRETTCLSKLLRDYGGYRLMEELGMKPRVYYLPPVNRRYPNPAEQKDKVVIKS